ncbi:MAG: iron-containing alcohol dehydrogenase [Thermogemmata sp.]|uniref:Iron-containing alcohol dehydrogenase n=1 Tax=Thermogemmata fonticola TaxID=2755323 RepID=A0A7V8VEB0_9BACT|nr:iron-containing alcohol dehydrogenase [Thermogemmata fonticola]MBA2226470.1 iron-containing alcohol dehydrogenase [Thermogemmata fonticola]MCX8140745.1 iron-containing alcohol dehydrogenase [Gemmataceae bacterium]GIW84915.1 MAG: iron alcohol dehydrogenase [Gemmataceae bacterium]
MSARSGVALAAPPPAWDSIAGEQLLPFDFQPLNRVIAGPGVLQRLDEAVQSLGGQRVLLVTDPGLEQAGHPQRAQAILEAAGLKVALFDGVKENPTEREVEAGTEFARSHQIDCIVAVGGGSAMDCAKGINFLLTNGGRMSDYKGFGKASRPMLPSIGVPTTAGTGSEAQSYALITDEKTHLKMACGDRKAAFRIVLLDPELTLTQPQQVTAATGIDAIAHAVESFVCTRRNAFSQMLSRTAWHLLSQHFETVLREPRHLPARWNMLLGAHLAGMAIENSMLGICHSCANPLTAHYGITHGVAIGIMLPHVIRFNGEWVEPLYAELLAHEYGGKQRATDQLVERTLRFTQAAGLPQSLRDCGVSRTILPLLAEEAHQQWTARFNPRPVTENDLLRVYEAAW